MKLYIVTSGYYEDYHIDGVFLDRETADLYVKYNDNDGMIVEEWETSEYKAPENAYYVCSIRYMIDTDRRNPNGDCERTKLVYSQKLNSNVKNAEPYNRCDYMRNNVYIDVERYFKEDEYKSRECELRDIVEKEANGLCDEVNNLIKDGTPLKNICALINK